MLDSEYSDETYLDPLEDWICIDVETSSFLNLRDVTPDVYAQHESTHVYTAVIGRCFHDNDSVLELSRWRPGGSLSGDLVEFIAAGGRIVAFNAGFERAIWRHLLTPEYGWPATDIAQWRDAQANAVAMALPASLEKTAAVLFGDETQKDMAGATLMQKMARTLPKENGEWVRPLETEANINRLEDYCATDVLVTGRVYENLCALPLNELRVWACDQEINERGIYIDRDRARKMLAMVHTRAAEIAKEAHYESGGHLTGVQSVTQLKLWLQRQTGRDPAKSLDKSNVEELLAGDELPKNVRRVLELRAEASRITSLGKLKRIRDACSPDGRVRGALSYHRAHTGRWSSRLLQVHNLPKDRRSSFVQDLCSFAIDEEDYGLLDMLWSPLDALSLGLRSLIAAAPGYDLIAADYSAIEARVLPWLAGDAAKLQLFDDGVDIYVKSARDIGSNDRQLGKVCELALGYGMGVVTFTKTAKAWGVPLSNKRAKTIAKAWRDKNPAVTKFWTELEQAFKACVREAARKVRVGKLVVASNNDGSVVYIKLPSGRYLWYHNPSIKHETRTVEVVQPNGSIESVELDFDSIYFWHANAGRWMPTSTYGGKLVENCTQAVARDILAEALLRLRPTDYAVVMHVHDSIVAEVAKGTGSVAEFEHLITDMPPWAKGLPLAAEGYRGPRFIG